MWYDWLLLIVGMVLLIKGADFFVDGSSRIAKALKIPSLIIGLTLVSMGTSAPEASVSINSAVNGLNDLSIGNVVGSNIFNTFLILGLSSLFAPLVISKEMRIYDIPIMVGLYVVLILFSFITSPLVLDIFESIGLLVLFVGYMVFLVLRAKKNPPSEEVLEVSNEATEDVENKKKEEKKKPIWLSIIFVIGGLAAIIFGGDLVVDSASNIAIKLGMSEALVGLTIVAVGTSLPELVTSVVATAKKELDIAIGNVIGSNIFNVVFILGLSSTISNLSVNSEQLFDMLVMLGSGLAVLLIGFASKKLCKWQGALLFLAYVAYLVYIIVRN
ncbi:MAG: calcium/sodium antiporter [Acholeplasmatales bacterium]|nr:calcium/sodium antiporter [Acholeplasmatales bacterium]